MPEDVGYQKIEFNGEILEFPKNMPDEEIAKVLREQSTASSLQEQKTQEVLGFLAENGWDLQDIK